MDFLASLNTLSNGQLLFIGLLIFAAVLIFPHLIRRKNIQRCILEKNKKGEIIETDFEAQTVRIFKNIELILKEAGATLDDIIKFTVYLKDMNNVKLFREIRNRFCSVPRPASTAIEVTGLVPGAIVEVEVVAECGGC